MHGLSRTVSGINGDFSRRAQISPPRVFNVPAEAVRLATAHRCLGSKNYDDGAAGPRKKFDDIFTHNNNNNNNAIRRTNGRRKYTLTKGPFAFACVLTIWDEKN